MDWYQFAFGRPAPGQRPTRRDDYLAGRGSPSRNAEVDRAGGAVRVPVVPEPPEWSRPNTERRALDVRQGRTRAAAEPSWVFPSGDPMIQPEDPSVSVPLSGMTGQDDTPYGNDFATWYEGTRRRPLPSDLRAVETAPQDRVAAFEWGLNTDPRVSGDYPAFGVRSEGEPNPGFQPYELRPGDGARGVAPPDAAGATRGFDPDEAWAAAQERALERWRRGEPTQADIAFAAIMGRRPQGPVTNARRSADGAVRQGSVRTGPLD